MAFQYTWYIRIYHIPQCVVSSVTGSSKCCLPDLWVALMYNLRQQLRGLLEAATQLIQFLLHGKDSLLKLPIGVIPVGTEVAHNHLHLLKSTAQHKYFDFEEKKKHLGVQTKPKTQSLLNSVQMYFKVCCRVCVDYWLTVTLRRSEQKHLELLCFVLSCLFLCCSSAAFSKQE